MFPHSASLDHEIKQLNVSDTFSYGNIQNNSSAKTIFSHLLAIFINLQLLFSSLSQFGP